MRESIPKRKNQNSNNATDFTQPQYEIKEDLPNQVVTQTNSINTQTINPDIVLGKILKEVRHSGNNLLFAMLTQIKGYSINLDNFVIICDSVVNYQDLKDIKVLEILNNCLQKFDYNLKIEVQLQEDNSKEIREENIRLLKETFGSLLKLKE